MSPLGVGGRGSLPTGLGGIFGSSKPQPLSPHAEAVSTSTSFHNGLPHRGAFDTTVEPGSARQPDLGRRTPAKRGMPRRQARCSRPARRFVPPSSASMPPKPSGIEGEACLTWVDTRAEVPSLRCLPGRQKNGHHGPIQSDALPVSMNVTSSCTIRLHRVHFGKWESRSGSHLLADKFNTESCLLLQSMKDRPMCTCSKSIQ